MSFLKNIVVIILTSAVITAIILLVPYTFLKSNNTTYANIAEAAKDDKIIVAYVKALNSDLLEINFKYGQNKSEVVNRKRALKILMNYFIEGRVIIAVKSGTDEVVILNMRTLPTLNIVKIEIKTVEKESSIVY